MNRLIMETKREGYTVDQVGSTMTVGELIAFLEQFDDETPIYTSHDGGYTYGSIEECDFR